MKDNEKVKHCRMFVRNKHLYSTTTLNPIVGKVEAKKSNFEGDIKCVSDMIKWWIVIRMNLLNTFPRVFEDVKKTKERTQRLDIKGDIVRVWK